MHNIKMFLGMIPPCPTEALPVLGLRQQLRLGLPLFPFYETTTAPVIFRWWRKCLSRYQRRSGERRKRVPSGRSRNCEAAPGFI